MKYLKTTFLIFSLLASTVIAKEQFTNKSAALSKTAVDSKGSFDGNRIKCDLENNGMIISHRITGHSGLEWPKSNNTYAVYASGVWLAGKVDGEIRTAVAEYGPERVPGPYGTDPENPHHKLYKVNRSDLADPYFYDDFQNWPVDLGAPWVDVDNDGSYSPLPAGPDHPDFIGDQVIWYVSNDGDSSGQSVFGTAPLGVEVHTTIFGFDRVNVTGDIMFVKELIINKGGNTIEDMYIGLWSDPDLGDASDDFVGCDTTLGMGICYNDGTDGDYAGFSGGTPAVGYDFFQGPIVPSTGDTAFAHGRYIPDYKNLSMTSFTKYINSDDPVWSDPNDPVEMYNLMKGLMKSGVPFADNITGGTPFVHPGDPSLDTGPTDTEYVDWDVHSSDDRRFLMNSGPFTMTPGDSQEVVFGIMMAAAGGPLSSYQYLKEVDALAQLAYDIRFALPESPPQPEVTDNALTESIILTWDDNAESYSALDVIDKLPVAVSFDTTWITDIEDVITTTHDTVIVGSDTTITTTIDTTFNYVQIVDVIDTTFSGENTTFTFEGYNVYQVETLSGSGAIKRLATYDLVNGVTEIFDDVFDPNLGETINKRVKFGSDSGIRRFISIDQDGLNNNSPLAKNRVYYYAVTAYGYNPYGIPRTLESSMKIIAVRPQDKTLWTEADSTAVHGDSYPATHSEGLSDGSVSVTIIDPSKLTGDDYSVSFADELIADGDTTAVINWKLTNTTTGSVLIGGNATQGGIDFVTGVAVGDEANLVAEGLQVAVAGPPNEFKDFYVTHNADGAIAGWAGAAAEYNGYPGMGRDNIDNQQSNGSTWFITTSNSSNKNYEDFFPYVTRYAGGYGNSAGGMQYLVPDDFEFRFTATGSKMLNRGTGLVVDTPLEIWNIGAITDPNDDFQLMGIFNDDDENGEWNLATDDHAISGGTNDPYLDAFYVLEHMDRAPGSAGYDAMVAALTADPEASGAYIWATGPGLSLSVPGQITRVVMLNMTIANWNGGDVEDATFPANVDAVMPEEGTIFRMTTTKPNATSDVFTFKLESASGKAVAYSPDAINAWPNPYFGYNPEERNPVDHQMHFTHLPESGSCVIRIFDLAGVPARRINHDNGTQFEVWDLTNNYGIPVASGMYIVHIETDAGDQVLKVAVVLPEQRLDVY